MTVSHAISAAESCFHSALLNASHQTTSIVVSNSLYSLIIGFGITEGTASIYWIGAGFYLLWPAKSVKNSICSFAALSSASNF